MITDNETNYVYFSEIIRKTVEYQSAFKRIQSLLEKHQINYGFLSNTKDIWCRDYMPIQVNEDRYIQFRYEPSYLINDLELQSVPQDVLHSNKLTAIHSHLNVDGGNIVSCSDKAILTTRIFAENTNFNRHELIAELEELLGVEVLLIPDVKDDMTGHSDGHLRFINSSTLLVNKLENEYPYWKKGFLKMIKDSKLDFIEMPWFEPAIEDPEYSAIGCYVNYLEIDNLILFPIFEVPNNKDTEALKTIRKVFPDRIIEPVNINEIARNGGLLNCSTWTVKK